MMIPQILIGAMLAVPSEINWTLTPNIDPNYLSRKSYWEIR